MNVTSTLFSKVNSFCKWAIPAPKKSITFEIKKVKNSYGCEFDSRTGWLANFKGGFFERREDAILIHGSRQTGLVWLNGRRVSADQFTKEIKSVYNIDLGASKKPIHLVACHVSTGFAQDISNITRRTVKTYDNGKFVSAHSMKLKNLVVLDDNGPKKPTHKFKPLDI